MVDWRIQWPKRSFSSQLCRTNISLVCVRNRYAYSCVIATCFKSKSSLSSGFGQRMTVVTLYISVPQPLTLGSCSHNYFVLFSVCFLSCVNNNIVEIEQRSTNNYCQIEDCWSHCLARVSKINDWWLYAIIIMLPQWGDIVSYHYPWCTIIIRRHHHNNYDMQLS